MPRRSNRRASPPITCCDSAPALPEPSRREWLRLAGTSAVALPLAAAGIEPLAQTVGLGNLPESRMPGALQAAEPQVPSAAAPQLTPLNRFSRMVQEYFVSQVRQAEARGQANRQALQTRADAEAYVQSVRERIRQSFGPFPEKTPLQARITGTLDRGSYKIEKVIFESRPGFLVTANLYLPQGRKRPMPGVIGTCGHSTTGKAEPAYQSFAQGLARQGYVVLIYDPIGQGERLQYVTPEFKPRMGVGVGEHLYAGNQQVLVDEFLGLWRAWDGIRALDYLLERPEVDPRHVGVTGNSGGGTMTTWLCGLDPRWTMAAPSCFVTTFRRNLENELPADSEQCPPRCLALSLDHSDFLAAMAPKPVIVLAKERDYFDARGSEETFARLKQLYTLLGAPDNIGLFIGPTPHGYTQENREAMYRWFNRVTGVSQATSEPELSIEPAEALLCTPRGQVAAEGSRPIFEFTAAKASQLVQARTSRSTGSATQAALPERIRRALKLPSLPSAVDYRILRLMKDRRYPRPSATTYAVETEPGIQALVMRLTEEPHYSRPARDTGRAVLYVAHQSADAELRDEPLVAELLAAEPTAAFYTCEVRGIGDSRPDTCGTDSFKNAYGSDYFYAAHALMLDYPYLGMKTFDLLVVLRWLASLGHREVHLAAKGWGALCGALAAVLSETVVQVTLKQALSSYADVAESETYRWPLSALPSGVLAHFDLPDCYQALAGKKLRQIDPVGAEGIA